MANKADRQYFENFIEASDYTCQASKYLVECLNNFNLDNIKAMLDTMHELDVYKRQHRTFSFYPDLRSYFF